MGAAPPREPATIAGLQQYPHYPSGRTGPHDTPDSLNEGPDDWDERPNVLSSASQDTHSLGRTTSSSTPPATEEEAAGA